MTTLSLAPTSAENHPAAADLDFYRVFAYSFGLPSPERFAWLSSREYRSLLKTLSSQLDLPKKTGRVSRFPDYSAYEPAYLALFEVGLPAPPVPLLESAYSRSGPAQQVVLDCVNFYDVLGLRPSDSVFPADHLVTKLEFLAAVRFLRAGTSNAEQASQLLRLECDFIERHLLSWLPAAQEKLEKLNPPIFLLLLRLLHSFLRAEFASLAAFDPS
jgi:DMSO reductase family type II enzyme chaperone